MLVKKPDLTLFKTVREAEKPGFFRLKTKIFRIPTEETGFQSLVATHLERAGIQNLDMDTKYKIWIF
jgi:hypothetical protein